MMSSAVPVFSISRHQDKFACTVLGGESLPTTGRYEILGVHGAGVVNGEYFVTTSRDLVIALHGYNESVETLGTSIRGALTLYIRDIGTGNAYVLSDVLGASSTFRYASDEIEYYSSSLPRLLAELRAEGIHLRKSLKYAAVLASAGHGGLVESPYDEITTVGLFKYVAICQDGVGINDYPLKEEFFGHFTGYGSDLKKLRKRLAEDISANVRAATNYQARRHVCQLSSGIDDRIVTAAINRCGSGPEYNMYNNGAPSDPNTLISLQLAGRFGYQVSKDPGYSAAMIAGKAVEDSRWRLHETAGVLRGPATPGIRVEPNLLLTSGFASLLGGLSTHAYDAKPAGPFPANDLDRAVIGVLGDSNARHGSILAESLLSEFRETIQKLSAQVAEINAPSSAIENIIWLATKGRYQDGESSRSMSTFVARFDPLYSPWALPVSWCYSKVELFHNFLKLDLIAELDPVSVSLPFGNRIDIDEYIAQRPTLKKQDFLNAPAIPSPRKTSTSALTCHNSGLQLSDKNRKDANRLRVPVTLFVNAENYQRRLREIIPMIDKESLEACFNVSRLSAMIDSRPQRLAEFRSLQNLHDSLAWYVEQS